MTPDTHERHNSQSFTVNNTIILTGQCPMSVLVVNTDSQFKDFMLPYSLGASVACCMLHTTNG